MIATVCDVYKVEMFLDEFEKAGIDVIKVEDFMPGVKSIICHSEQVKVKPIVDKVTQHFYNIDRQKKNN